MSNEVCGSMKARYVNPYTDFGFKKLFGEEANKEIANFTPEQLAQNEESLKTYRDLKGVVDTSYEEGKAEGRVEGKIEMARQIFILLPRHPVFPKKRSRNSIPKFQHFYAPLLPISPSGVVSLYNVLLSAFVLILVVKIHEQF